MALDIHHETAKIYQFPVRPRRRLGNGSTAPESIYEFGASVVDTDCWYHDEAMAEDAPAKDRPKPC